LSAAASTRLDFNEHADKLEALSLGETCERFSLRFYAKP